MPTLSRIGYSSFGAALCWSVFSAAAQAQLAIPEPMPIMDAGHSTLSGVQQVNIVRSTINSVYNSSPDNMPVDLAPVQIPSRINRFNSAKEGAMYFLPARMYLNANVENSLRLETNVFQSSRGSSQDMTYRILPNVTLGYALTRKTRVSANYFLLRDQYMAHSSLLTRNIQSVGFAIDHDFPLTRKTTLTTGFFARELLLTNSQPLNDLIPTATLVRRIGQSGILYSSVMGQMRFRNVLGEWQEADQFYSVGAIRRKGLWVFSADSTLVTNFGVRRLRGGPNNQNIILTFEADRQISRKLPLVAFLRVQPIFNTGANQAVGFAGTNVRVFGGLRLDIAKPAIFPVKIDKHEKLAKSDLQL